MKHMVLTLDALGTSESDLKALAEKVSVFLAAEAIRQNYPTILGVGVVVMANCHDCEAGERDDVPRHHFN